MTDWGGDNDHAAGVKAGSNLVMPAPGADCAMGLLKALEEGRIMEADIDARVEEFLAVALELYGRVAKQPKTFDVDAHHAVARKCAEGSIVLLENDGILPLDRSKTVALIGDFAQTPRYQGAGSSQVNPTKLVDLKDALGSSGLEITGFATGYSRTDPKPDRSLIDPAVALAKMADVVLLCVGLDEIAESEGLDRTHLNLSAGQLALIEEVRRTNANVVLVLCGGAPFLMPGSDKFRAAIHGYLGGQAGAQAMADAILGKINPSGKLSETWPLALEHDPANPYYPSSQRTSEYREGLYVGYRYYDTAGVPVRYPFGYGISYTKFTYSELEADRENVSFTLANTGTMDGAEIAQVYISAKNSRVYRPRKELKGFAKVSLKAGESRRVTISLDDKAFRYFNTVTNRWETEPGEYEIFVAANVLDVRLSQTIRVDGAEVPVPELLPSYRDCAVNNVSDEVYAKLLGRPIPDGTWGGVLEKNDAICQMYYAKSGLARLACKLLTALKDKAEAKGKPDLNILFIYNMPSRAMGKMAGSIISEKMVDDILLIVNGHFFRGMGRLIADFFRNQRDSKKFLKKLEG